MTSLSILIPIETSFERPHSLMAALTAKPDPDLEIILAPQTSEIARTLDLAGLAATDRRIKLVMTYTDEPPATHLWGAALAVATGTWVTLVRPMDMIEAELIKVVRFIDQTLPDSDGFAWNALQVFPDDILGQSASMAIPTKYLLTEFDKTEMLKAFFLWEGSHNIPKMPFGLFHAACRRTLAMSVQQSINAAGRHWVTDQILRWEWAARTILMGEKFVFCARPLSVVEGRPFTTPSTQRRDFPFHGGLGLSGAIAEIQQAVFNEMGAAWLGMEENFIRGITIDCMLETDGQAFNAKCDGYFNALKQWQGGKFCGLFRPQFTGPRPPDTRRGLEGSYLMIDRHIGGAKTPQEFYNVIRHFLAPTGVICGGQAI